MSGCKKFLIFFILILALAGLAIPVVLLIVLPYINKNDALRQQQAVSTNQANKTVPNPQVRLELEDPPDFNVNPTDLGLYDDSAQANPYSPPLTEKFPYKTKKIRGVNLGGWLVPEPFIVPSFFKNHTKTNPKIIDEWSLCLTMGKLKCTEVLKQHYDSWLTEDDIRRLAEYGLNHVRIPLGYWSIENNEDEPFVYGAWKYLLRGIQWCRKYGIRVQIDFHAAPGSQNGWNHSGRVGEKKFLNDTYQDNQKNIDRFMRIVISTVKYFNAPEWNRVVTQIGVLNEPSIFNPAKINSTYNFYVDSYQKIRDAIGEDMLLSYHEGFTGLSAWENKFPNSTFKNIALDIHNYVAFTKEVMVMNLDKVAELPCDGWRNSMVRSNRNFGLTMCGEFSVASNDCGLYLNGLNKGHAYDGTNGKDAVCKGCTCKDKEDYTLFTKEYKDGLLKFAEKQMASFEMGMGWYFWNFKTENKVNPHWDYLLGVEEGWLPRDAGVRSNTCSNTTSTGDKKHK